MNHLPPYVSALTNERSKVFVEVSILILRSSSELKGSEYVLLIMIFMATFGVGVAEQCLSISDFLNGYSDERGTESGSGLSKPTIVRGLQSLSDIGIVERRRANYHDGYIYRINVATLLQFSNLCQ